MPQIVKGGKYIFGRSVVSEDGTVLIPEEARLEYGFSPGERVIFIPGSKTSGGFSLCKKAIIEQSRLSGFLMQNPDLVDFRVAEGEIILVSSRSICWTTILDSNQLQLSPRMLETYGVEPYNRLLAVRGSYVGLGMLTKGPVVAEAANHPEIPVFTPEEA